MVKGAVDVDIGANPSAEGGEDEGVDDQAVKVVDIVDTFRLQVILTYVYRFGPGFCQIFVLIAIWFVFRSNLLSTKSNLLHT